MDRKRTILIIEDNRQDELLTLRALKANGFESDTVICRDGYEALEWIFARGNYCDRDKSIVPRVVLLDLKLPKLDGHEVLCAIRSDQQTKHLPVVVLTTSKEEIDIAKSYDNGANSFVQKPVSFEEFSEVIKRLGIYWLFTNETVHSIVMGASPV